MYLAQITVTIITDTTNFHSTFHRKTDPNFHLNYDKQFRDTPNKHNIDCPTDFDRTAASVVVCECVRHVHIRQCINNGVLVE